MYAFNPDEQTYVVYNPPRAAIREKMEAGIYRLNVNPMTGTISFARQDMFELPSRIYGNAVERAGRVLQTFHSRPLSNTGVLLIGDAGSGKSLLAKLLCNTFVKEVPDGVVIIPDAPYTGSLLENILNDIKQPCTFFVDEFEKLYDQDKQNKLLTTMDGGAVTGKLFIKTANDIRRVNSHMLDRPSRFFYRYDFAGLDSEFIREYAEENLNDKGEVTSLLTLASQVPNFSMDILKSLIEESNRYGEPIMDAAVHLNLTLPRNRRNYETWHLSRLVIDGLDLTSKYETKRIYESLVRLDDDELCLEPLPVPKKPKPENGEAEASAPVNDEPEVPTLPTLLVNCSRSAIKSADDERVVFRAIMNDSGRTFDVETVWRKGYGADKVAVNKLMDDGQRLASFLEHMRHAVASA